MPYRSGLFSIRFRLDRMPKYLNALYQNFLGQSPDWYKLLILVFLAINPLLAHFDAYLAGWILIGEFILTLAMALKCYPLQPGGLLALEAVAIGLASPQMVYTEVESNLQVILLLVFMVAGIYFMKDLLLDAFTRILLGIRSKAVLAMFFCLTAAVLSAFLDALTVTAVVLTVCMGFYSVYHKVASGKDYHHEHDAEDDDQVYELHRSHLDEFRAFLRSLLMHAAVGTALGGVCTQVGEPQNLIIAQYAGWDFIQFFNAMAVVSMPTLALGLMTCYLLEKTGTFGYGRQLPEPVRDILSDYAASETAGMTPHRWMSMGVQAVVALLLIVALALHLAEVGLIGLGVIILTTSLTGVTNEHQIARAFEEALPFTALLVVFFAIVGVIHDQHLFNGIINEVLVLDKSMQPGMFFIANGVLSMISDNVFVATVYMDQVHSALQHGVITKEHMQALAVAINAGTNLPSVATPNGQAAFLFMLTSALAPLVRLSYGRMVWMALPYTVVMGVAGFLLVEFFV